MNKIVSVFVVACLFGMFGDKAYAQEVATKEIIEYKEAQHELLIEISKVSQRVTDPILSLMIAEYRCYLLKTRGRKMEAAAKGSGDISLALVNARATISLVSARKHLDGEKKSYLIATGRIKPDDRWIPDVSTGTDFANFDLDEKIDSSVIEIATVFDQGKDDLGIAIAVNIISRRDDLNNNSRWTNLIKSIDEDLDRHEGKVTAAKKEMDASALRIKKIYTGKIASAGTMKPDAVTLENAVVGYAELFSRPEEKRPDMDALTELLEQMDQELEVWNELAVIYAQVKTGYSIAQIIAKMVKPEF